MQTTGLVKKKFRRHFISIWSKILCYAEFTKHHRGKELVEIFNFVILSFFKKQDRLRLA